MTAVTPPEWEHDPFRLLISYHYWRGREWMGGWLDALPGGAEVFCDSGAFTAYTQGSPIRHAEYAAWLSRWRSRFQIVANLDVIGGDWEGTARNQRRLEKAGCADYVLPVFHGREPWHVLERLLDDGYPYIAVGGLVGVPAPARMRWLVKAFKLAEGRAVFHGFGLTSWDHIRNLPFYSVDSSSWVSGFRFGNVTLFDRGRWLSLALRDHREVYRHAELIRGYGFNPNMLAGRRDYNRLMIAAISAAAWRRAEKWCRELHGPVTVSGHPHRPAGLRLYLADDHAANLTAAHHWVTGVITDSVEIGAAATKLRNRFLIDRKKAVRV